MTIHHNLNTNGLTDFSDMDKLERLKEEIKLKADVNPDPNKIDELRRISKPFRSAWDGKSLSIRIDETPLGHSRNIALYALRHRCSSQEAADLLICWHRKHGIDPKLGHQDCYILDTILRAERELCVQEASTALEEEIDAVEETVLKNLGTMLGLQELGYSIAGFYQHGKQDARYWLEIDTGEESPRVVTIGSSRELRSVQRLKDLFIANFGMVIPASVTRARWDNILQNLMRVRQVKDPDIDDREEQVREWVESLCNTWARPFNDEGENRWELALPTRSPFKREGEIFVNAARIREMLMRDGTRMSLADITQMLRLAGLERRKVSGRVEGKVIATSYWAAPLSEFPGV